MEHLYFIFQNIWNRIGNVRPSDSARYRGRGVIWIFPLLITALFFISISNAEVMANESVSKDNTAKSQAQVTYGSLPLYFIQNDGQVDEQVKYYEKSRGHATFFMEDGVYIGLHKTGNSESNENNQSSMIKLSFVDGKEKPEITAEGVQQGKVNYFRGNNPAKWRTKVPTYQTVSYKEVYPGIDLKFYGNNNQMEYDVIVKPGADPSKVKFAYEGIEGLEISEEGNLDISLKEGKFIQKRPVIYQEIDEERISVNGKFRILEGDVTHKKFVYAFEIAAYDTKQPLIIDPVLAYATYLGGNDYDGGEGIAIDASGNIYVTGSTYSLDFPTTLGAYDTSFSGDNDVFIVKFDSSGTSLLAATYMGGSSYDWSLDIALDSSGNVLVVLETGSSDFPTTPGAYDTTYNGAGDIIIAKLDSSLSTLLYSTYLGGTLDDNYADGRIAVDNSGNAYLAGYTYSTDFPTTPGAYDTSFNGVSDVFVAKLDSSGSCHVPGNRYHFIPRYPRPPFS